MMDKKLKQKSKFDKRVNVRNENNTGKFDMKKIFLFLLCIVAVFFSVFAVVRYVSKYDTNMPKNDISIDGTNEHINIVAEKIIDVPAICQYPELPTGCESVAATMVLQYYGVDITPAEFVISWLEYSENFYTANGNQFGPDPNEVFAGNPFTNNSYGCFATPIVNAINRNSKDCTALKITNRSLEELCAEYIDNDKPLLIWATMGMRESYAGKSWCLADGSVFTWIAQEHCLVLVGYNDNYYFLNDPISGSTVAYQKNIVEKRFKELGNQAIYIHPNEM